MKKHRQYTIPDYKSDRAFFSPGRGSRQTRTQKRQQGSYLGILALLVILAALVWFSWPYLPWNEPNRTTAQPTVSATTDLATSASATAATTPPTPETTTATTKPSGETSATLSPSERQARLTAAGNQVQALLKGKTGRFAVFFQDLLTGDTWKTNETIPFVAASSIKLGINTYLYTQIAGGAVLPDEKLAYDSRPYPVGDYEAGTGTIKSMPNGTKLSVRETSGLSIRISDNCGTNMIIRRLGGIDAINPQLRQISGAVDYRQTVTYKNYVGQTMNGRHRTCALDLGLHAVWLYQLWQAAPDLYQPLVDDLCQTEFDYGIQKGVPDGIRVAHKIGTNGTYSAENDVGIVFAAKPFVLCVMTEMASAAAAHQIQADIAAIFCTLAAAKD
jgi:beta-lactamase class A